MLYTLNCSPWHCDINNLLRMLHINDDLLLIQDGVLAAIEGSRFIDMFINTPSNVYALKNDVEARGLVGQLSSQVNMISYVDFVNLSIKQYNHMNWQ